MNCFQTSGQTSSARTSDLIYNKSVRSLRVKNYSVRCSLSQTNSYPERKFLLKHLYDGNMTCNDTEELKRS